MAGRLPSPPTLKSTSMRQMVNLGNDALPPLRIGFVFPNPLRCANGSALRISACEPSRNWVRFLFSLSPASAASLKLASFLHFHVFAESASASPIGFVFTKPPSRFCYNDSFRPDIPGFRYVP